VVGITGRFGCGKTALIRALLGQVCISHYYSLIQRCLIATFDNPKYVLPKPEVIKNMKGK